LPRIMKSHPQKPDLQIVEGAGLGDLDAALLDDYRQRLAERRPGSGLETLPLEMLLLRVGAANRQGKRIRPTVAGILFFAADPQRFFPSLTTTFLHFPGTTISRQDDEAPLYLDNRELTGPVPEMIEDARAAIYQATRKEAVVEGFVRHDVTEYPEFAVREAVVNAVAHRDYRRTGSFIQIRLFSDRLEVQNPGGLTGGVTVDNIVYEQFTRNPYIVRFLEDYGYVERRGLGIDEMIASMERAGLAPPRFDDRQTSFWVTLYNRATSFDPASLGLNERQLRALDYLRKRGRISNREYQALNEVAERTALYDLQELVKKDLLLPMSSGRGRYYILKSANRRQTNEERQRIGNSTSRRS